MLGIQEQEIRTNQPCRVYLQKYNGDRTDHRIYKEGKAGIMN